MGFLRSLEELYSRCVKTRFPFRSKEQILVELRALDFNLPDHLEKAKSLFAECDSWMRCDIDHLNLLSNLPCRPRFNFDDKELVDMANVVSTMRLAALVVVSAVLDAEGGADSLRLAVASLKYQAVFLKYVGYEDCDFPLAFKWDSVEVARDTILEWKNSGKSRKEICDIVTAGFDELAWHIKRRVMARYDVGQIEHETFWQYIPQQMHRTSRDLFEQKHFAESVEAAFKEINVIVKNEVFKRTGLNVDGVNLMHRAFRLKDPVINLSNANCEDTRLSEQQGYMDLFAGAMAALRNPKAHANVKMTKDDAVQQLMFAGLLLHRFESFVSQSEQVYA